MHSRFCFQDRIVLAQERPHGSRGLGHTYYQTRRRPFTLGSRDCLPNAWCATWGPNARAGLQRQAVRSLCNVQHMLTKTTNSTNASIRSYIPELRVPSLGHSGHIAGSAGCAKSSTAATGVIKTRYGNGPWHNRLQSSSKRQIGTLNYFS